MKTTISHTIMKPLPLLLALISASCVSKSPPPRIVDVAPPVPARDLNHEETAAVLHPESIKAYPLGRYVDPHRRDIMHEAHTIYRVETTPKWNLATRGKTTGPIRPDVSRQASSPNELLVELNRQRQTTKAVMESGRTLTGKLTDLATSLHKNQQALAEQNAGIRRDLKTTRERLEALERKVDEQPRPEAFPASDEEAW